MASWKGGMAAKSRTQGFLLVGTDPSQASFDKALVGQTVGSRVLAVVPPPEGSSEDTAVMVVDILAAG